MKASKMNIFEDKKIVSVTSEVRSLADVSKLESLLDPLFKESYILLLNLLDMKEYILELKDSDLPSIDLIDQECDEFEDFLALYDVDTLNIFNSGLATAQFAIQRRLKTTLNGTQVLCGIMSKCLSDFIVLNDAEIEKVLVILNKTIDNLIYFINFQFKVDDSFADLYESENIRVSSSIKAYCKEYLEAGEDENKKVLDLVLELHELYLKHKPTIPALQDNPQLLEDFEDVMGASLIDIADIVEDITVQDAINLINGSIDVSAFLEEMDGVEL